jgi:tRNA isopentenyl-2-thiomethyl-A-37 hydroxylase MiaE
MALNLIDSYGSYLDLYKTLVLAGMLQCQSMITKLVSLAKYDPHHKEAIQGLQKAKVLMFYEPVRAAIFCYTMFIQSKTNPNARHIRLTRTCSLHCTSFCSQALTIQCRPL